MIDRYSRQTAYKNISEQDQELLGQANVAIVGLGGIGSNAATQLARAGVGHLKLIDHDVVELTNLQRQTLYTEENVGEQKAEVAYYHLDHINSEVDLTYSDQQLTADNAKELLNTSDFVLDCTDNLEIRFIINQYCHSTGKPWVHASCLADFGYIKVFRPSEACYACFTHDAPDISTCREEGVLGNLVAAIASLQVTQAIKLILDKETCTDLIYLNIWKPDLRFITIKQDPNCNVCGGN